MRPKVHEEALRQRAPISLQLTLCNLPDAALAMQLYDYIAKRAAMGPPRPPAAAAAAAAAANAPSRHWARARPRLRSRARLFGPPTIIVLPLDCFVECSRGRDLLYLSTDTSGDADRQRRRASKR